MLGNRERAGLSQIELLVVIATITLLTAVLVPAVQQAREAARKNCCSNNFRQVALACNGFAECGKWPGGSGRPWPVEAGPQLGVPSLQWVSVPIGVTDGEQFIRVLTCPSDLPVRIDGYAVSNIGLQSELVGQPLSEITDGLSNTVLAGELPSSSGVTWALEPLLFPAALKSVHPGGAHVVLADGKVRFISLQINFGILSGLFTPNGNEVLGEW